jgi:hypothetical protein
MANSQRGVTDLVVAFWNGNALQCGTFKSGGPSIKRSPILAAGDPLDFVGPFGCTDLFRRSLKLEIRRHSILENSKAFSGFAAGDLGKVKDFETKILGLKIAEKHRVLTLHPPITTTD